MFEWTEIALIGVVALVAIGPKDLPVAIKTVAAMVKARLPPAVMAMSGAPIAVP